MTAASETVSPGAAGFVDGLRVLEIGGELGEYAGRVLVGLGADVVRVEPREGSPTRAYGPFVDDVPDPEKSLYWWHYNHGKRSVALDLDSPQGCDELRRLARQADLVIESMPRGWAVERGVDADTLLAELPHLLHLRVTPFGDTGPWADYVGSDLIHLALGGVMMNCGYDPDPRGFYDTPPIAPQMWQAYHITGEQAVISVLGALVYRHRTGRGQAMSVAVHEAVSKNTETDAPDWLFLGQRHRRLTCRHSMVSASLPALAITKDGRYALPYKTYLKGSVTADASAWESTVAVLREYGSGAALEEPQYATAEGRQTAAAVDRLSGAVEKLFSSTLYSADVWRAGQRHGLPWAPVRLPEENVTDPHWRMRGAVVDLHEPALARAVAHVGAKWYSEDAAWAYGGPAPRVGEHTAEVRRDWAAPSTHRPVASIPTDEVRSVHGAPFALGHVRVIDLSWMLASAGAGRFLAALGADVIKVEHDSRLDGMRTGQGLCPPGGRDERSAATAPLPTPAFDRSNPNRSGSFMEINAGKRALSLNLKSPEGRRILEDLIRDADMVVEGFSPGTMERMGLGYARLKKLKPDIIYVQQSGMGEHGTYGRLRAFGPTAQAFTGISEMSGLPSPFPPAGIGYSYLDWFGAYNMANAMIAALYRRDRTGHGCHIDASQGEIGLQLTGTAFLDWSVNGRSWRRAGNRSPYRAAAPHGAYRTRGDDRWIALAVFDEEQWRALAAALGRTDWTSDPRFVDMAARLAHQDELDAEIEEATRDRDGGELMALLQRSGVAAGVCQEASDRYESDPQLAHLGWTVELRQSEIGTWPVKEHPVRMSVTPTHIGGRLDRSGPNYGEDTDEILAEILGFDDDRIAALRADGVV
ncbi:CaiB/BaiF CoA transferase family protein [Microbacterium sp. SLBN-111]|uniref:CaiB/BaiF CoA transferase family protein n=1 Tax=Microbacterium sp. SLBN-111 TaxID=3377733 RepID=UPI003C7886E4